MKELFLVRGTSGSGKTTFASMLHTMSEQAGNRSLLVAADDWFLNNDHEYVFDPKELNRAHTYCKDMVEVALRNGFNTVFVHNTFTTEKELAPYLELAEKYGYNVNSIVKENRHAGVNVHGVPEAKVDAQSRRLLNSIKTK